MSECTLIATITTQPLFRSLFSMVSLAYLSACVLHLFWKSTFSLIGTGVWATVRSNGSPYIMGPLSVLSVCNVRVLWPNGRMDQDATWY